MGFTQTANVTVAAFIQQDFQPGVLFAFAQQGGAFGGEEAVFGAGSGFELAQQRGIGNTVDLNMVGFVQMTGGIGDAVCPGGVIGEKQQAFAGLIESANGRQVGFWRAL